MNIGPRTKAVIRTSPRGSTDESHTRVINGVKYVFARRTWPGYPTCPVEMWAARVDTRKTVHKFTGPKTYKESP